MSVDANVLIFERIREELGNGNTPQASIRAGLGQSLYDDRRLEPDDVDRGDRAVHVRHGADQRIRGHAVDRYCDVDVHGDHRDARARQFRLRLAAALEDAVDRRPQDSPNPKLPATT